MSSGFGSLVRTLAIAIVFVTALSLVLSLWLNPTPAVEVTECLLTSSTVNHDAETSIRFTVVSNDDENTRLIEVEFSSHELVAFLLGSAELSRRDSLWVFRLTLNPRATRTELINVRPRLESGISELRYRITVVFYSDGEEIFNRNLDLTVRRP